MTKLHAASGVGMFLLSVSLSGCSGRAQMSGIPLSRNDLRDREPLVWNLPTAGQCAWYIDEKGQMNVAMKYENLPLLGKYSKGQWVTRLRLGDPPAGRSLRYDLAGDRFRAICSFGVEHRRFQSRWGVLVLDRLPGERFRGRFQITVAQQEFSLFGGWGPAGYAAPLLTMWGEFEAIHDAKTGQGIAAIIERENWDGMVGAIPLRAVRPATRPTTTRGLSPRPAAVPVNKP